MILVPKNLYYPEENNSDVIKGYLNDYQTVYDY